MHSKLSEVLEPNNGGVVTFQFLEKYNGGYPVVTANLTQPQPLPNVAEGFIYPGSGNITANDAMADALRNKQPPYRFKLDFEGWLWTTNITVNEV